MHPGQSPAPSSSSAPSAAEIFRAVPGGSRRARSQREWLQVALAEVEAQGWYANRAAHYADIVRRLALAMDWRRRTCWPGHENIARSVGVSADTVARAVAWLQARGLLGLVSPGTTADVRPAVLYAGTGNLAAVYVLTVPRRRSSSRSPAAGQSQFADLSRSRSDLDKAPRAREGAPKVKPEKARAPRGLPLLPRRGSADLHQCPKTRSDGLRAAGLLQDQSGRVSPLAQLSDRCLRHLARPFFAAGWTPADVLHAIDHEPGGRQHGYTAEVRSPAAWVRSRLAEWLDVSGVPLPSRSQQSAEARRLVLAEQAGRRADGEAARARDVDYAGHAVRAREMLARALARHA